MATVLDEDHLDYWDFKLTSDGTELNFGQVYPLTEVMTKESNCVGQAKMQIFSDGEFTNVEVPFEWNTLDSGKSFIIMNPGDTDKGEGCYNMKVYDSLCQDLYANLVENFLGVSTLPDVSIFC
mmetsp:Transcript_7619/g.9659  ORF Transcript_7619/g.9659 Transcript_7619/m.9659 type:complete len:123 (-) Transcript_7619:328-696(-)